MNPHDFDAPDAEVPDADAPDAEVPDADAPDAKSAFADAEPTSATDASARDANNSRDDTTNTDPMGANATDCETMHITETGSNVLGVDPGRAKSGLAVINRDGHILWRAIIAPDALEARLPELIERWNIAGIALGDSTASDEARAQIERVIGESEAPIELSIVDETGSTLEARELYWADNPRRGWRRLLPLSLQEPPEPIDDYAAAIVARRGI